MSKIKKILAIFLVGVCITFTSISSIAATPIEKSSKNPYVEQYLKEKQEKSNSSANKVMSSTFVDQQEENSFTSTLTKYYNDDVKVGNILNNYKNDTKLTDTATSLEKEDKIYIMHTIKNVYPSVKNKSEQKALTEYLKRYAKASKDEISIQFLNKLKPQVKSKFRNAKDLENEILEKKGNKSFTTASISVDNSATASISIDDSTTVSINIDNFATVSTSSYDGSYDGVDAGNWAYNNYDKFNSYYPQLTEGSFSDCTNFVSQAMCVGGEMPTQGDWYCNKKNSTYPKPKNVTELNYSWELSDPSPWISAEEFESFWSDKTDTLTYSKSEYKNDHDTIFDESIYKGDAVVLRESVLWWTVPKHVMIISAYDYSNYFKLAGHTNARKDLPLLTAIESYSEVEFITF